MFEIVKAGGWIMWPILLCSVLALAIIVERIWTLNTRKIIPPGLVAKIWVWLKSAALNPQNIAQMERESALGKIMAAGLNNSAQGRAIMIDSMQDAARSVAHDLEKYLDILGTIAAAAPLLGLLGTVFGMIEIFSEISLSGAQASIAILSGGISQALFTTAAGLTVAIPALIAHRLLSRKVDSILVELEQHASKLVDALHSERDVRVRGVTI